MTQDEHYFDNHPSLPAWNLLAKQTVVRRLQLPDQTCQFELSIAAKRQNAALGPEFEGSL